MKSEGWPSMLLSLLFVHWLVHLLSCSPVVSCVGRQQAVIEYRIGKVSGLSAATLSECGKCLEGEIQVPWARGGRAAWASAGWQAECV